MEKPIKIHIDLWVLSKLKNFLQHTVRNLHALNRFKSYNNMAVKFLQICINSMLRPWSQPLCAYSMYNQHSLLKCYFFRFQQ